MSLPCTVIFQPSKCADFKIFHWTDRLTVQTDRQADRQTDKQADRQTDNRQRDRQTDRLTDE